MQYVYLVVRLGQADLRGRACTEAEWAVGKEPGQICPEVPAFLKIKYVCLPVASHFLLLLGIRKIREKYLVLLGFRVFRVGLD
jgi:hypothetical protein